MWAAQEGRTDCARVLVEGGADKEAMSNVRNIYHRLSFTCECMRVLAYECGRECVAMYLFSHFNVCALTITALYLIALIFCLHHLDFNFCRGIG